METFPTQTNNEDYDDLDRTQTADIGLEPETEEQVLPEAHTAAEYQTVDTAEQEKGDEKLRSRVRLKLGSLACKIVTSPGFPMLMATAGSMAALNASDPTWWKAGIGIAAAVAAGINATETVREHFEELGDEGISQQTVAEFAPPPPPPPPAPSPFV